MSEAIGPQMPKNAHQKAYYRNRNKDYDIMKQSSIESGNLFGSGYMNHQNDMKEYLKETG